jgi:protein O-mannosyl-transferase
VAGFAWRPRDSRPKRPGCQYPRYTDESMQERNRRSALLAALVAAAALAAYADSLGNGFALDDSIVVEQNPLVASHAFGEILRTPYHFGPSQKIPTGLYRPLTTLTFALDHLAGGLHPVVYHATNVTLHAAVSVLVLVTGLAVGLAPGASLVGALLFAVHPVHSEAVANVSGRAELLAAAFFLLALLVFARGRDAEGRLSARRLVATAVLSFLAMLSKENAVTFVGAAAAFELLVRRSKGESIRNFLRVRRAELGKTLVVLLVPVALYLAARHAVLGGFLLPAGAVTPMENPVVGLPLAPRLATALAAAGRYALLLVFPRTLSPDYGWAETAPVHTLLDPWLLVGLLAGAGLVAGLALAWRRSRPAAFAILLAVVPFTVVSNLPFPIGTILAERLIYLPSAGFCLLAGAAWPGLRRRAGTITASALVTVLLAAGAARTEVANTAWHDDFALWSRALSAAPRSVRVLGNLGVELASRGRLDEARGLLLRAVALAPDFAPNRINLAGVLLRLGDLDGAEVEIHHVLEIEPGNEIARLQLRAILAARRSPPPP